MKISKLFSLAALALITTACSDQIEQVQQPRNTEGIPFTATISTEGHAATRLLAESGTSITATWATGEKVALIYTVGTTTYLEEATVTPQTDGTATISTTLEGSPVDDTDVTIVYPASAVDKSTKDVKTGLLTSQNGLLTGTGSISDKYDLRKTSTPAKLKIDGTTASLKGTVKLAQQVSIWKLTLQNGGVDVAAKTLTIKDASDNLLASAALTTAGSVFYVAVPDMTSVKLIAANGANSYSYSKSSVSISVGKYYQSTINLTPDYTDLSATATANTYIISSAGKYKFNATIKGNGGLDPLTGTTATPISKSSIAGVKVLWELGTEQGRTIKYDGSAYDISYDDGYVYFSTPETFTQGNCYVAIYNSSNEILWSWLIWAGAEPSEVTSGTDKFMNRNLGSIAVGNYSRGFLYQWGRKDPFPAADGNNYTPYSYVPARLTSHSIVEAPITVAYAIANPTHFTSHSAWMTTDDYRSNLWSDTEKTIYDPCPAGWRVPTRTQMNNFKTNVGLGTLPGTGFIGTCSAGGDFAYGNPGTGYYRSSTVINRDNSYSFCNDGRVDQSWPNYEGFAVRPVRDVPAATSKSVTSLTTNEIGWRIGSDGNAYSPGILPSGVTAVAMVAYVGSETDEVAPKNHGLAIALSDEASKMNWNQAMSETGAAAHTPSITGYSWKLPSRENWENMFNANGGNAESHTGLDAALTSVGGYVLLQGQEYWSSTRVTGTYDRVTIYINSTGAATASQRTDISGVPYVRACFAF
jgi:hypothetical protein